MSDDDRPLLRVMALHALAYCERLFYLEEVEEIRVADDRVYAGRTLHERLPEADADWCSETLESESLGLRGRIDYLKYRDGHLIPVEHKRGRSDNGEAWPSDRLQAAAYGFLLAEQFGEGSITEVHVRYHRDSATVRVPIDATARKELHEAIERARILSGRTARPPVTDNDRLCAACSLAPVCLPEEERFLAGADEPPTRLFPP